MSALAELCLSKCDGQDTFFECSVMANVAAAACFLIENEKMCFKVI